MSIIKHIRPVLLSAPYGDKKSNAEVQLHLPSGYRTCGMVEVTLENRISGLGEGYLAVFAPLVFKETVDLLAPLLVGKSVDDVEGLKNDLILATGYWSLQGAARHVISAIEIALMDALAQTRNMPLFQLLGGENKPLQLYGSGGDSVNQSFMEEELKYLKDLGINLFKIRARKDDLEKAVWTMNKAKEYDIEVAIDMTQNLSSPGQSVDDVLGFEKNILKQTGKLPVFIEEALGMDHLSGFPDLKMRSASPVAGGEIVTTELELIERINNGYYHIVQPDATVIGGVVSVMKVFDASSKSGVKTLVHCWGGPVGMMANYHAAIAGNGKMAEWPMPYFPLRDELVVESWRIESGHLRLGELPGLGVRLNAEIEEKYTFSEDAVYQCMTVSNHSNNEFFL